MDDPRIVLAIFIFSFVLIFSEVVHRAVAAWFGSTLILLYGHISGIFDTHGNSLEHTMLEWIEFEVIGLLLGMMVFAALLEICGFFEYIAVKATKLSGGNPWKLLVILGSFTPLISIAIDNVTAVIIIAPVTVKICNRAEINPIPLLIAEAILSNIGGVASMVGDPPNVMIAARAHTMPEIADSFGFNGFLFRLGLLTLFAWMITIAYFKWYYNEWTRKKPAGVEELLYMDEWDSVSDRGLMNSTLFFLALTVLLFSAKEFMHLDVEIHAIALAGAGFALFVSRPMEEDLRDGFINDVIDKVEWQALIFFAGLFILVGSLENVGYLNNMAAWIFENFGSDDFFADIEIISLANTLLKKILPESLKLSSVEAKLIALIKPQFEVGKKYIGKGGVVRDKELRESCCKDIKLWLEHSMNWKVTDIIESPIKGRKGNIEYLIYAHR
mgnify:CR=1 FL=1